VELLVGCGNRREKLFGIDGVVPKEWTELITLDIDETLKPAPSIIHDLEDLPLPFDDDMFDEVHAYEVLEHTGQQGDWRFFFNQFYEFWRILKPGGFFFATTPMWDGLWAWGDPGHKRIISEGTLVFLSQLEYKKQVGNGSMTDYRHYWEGDFELYSKKEEGETFGFVIRAIKDGYEPDAD
jgi:SAM-dependent methyltransferase